MERIIQRLVRDELRFRKKLAVLEYARECGNAAKAWREFNVPKSTLHGGNTPYEVLRIKLERNFQCQS